QRQGDRRGAAPDERRSRSEAAQGGRRIDPGLRSGHRRADLVRAGPPPGAAVRVFRGRPARPMGAGGRLAALGADAAGRAMKRSRLLTKVLIAEVILFAAIGLATSGIAANTLASRLTSEFSSKGTAI